ncbi:hypothetical protein D3C75_797940 [compost metagenome]
MSNRWGLFHYRQRKCRFTTTVGDYLAVLQFDNALCVLRHLHIVSDDHYRMAALIKFAEDLQHFLTRSGVQGAGGLIRQDNFSPVD